jgi:hypothetical protein
MNVRSHCIQKKANSSYYKQHIHIANFYIQMMNTMWKVNYKNLRIFSVSATDGSSNVTLPVTLSAEYCGHLLYGPL